MKTGVIIAFKYSVKFSSKYRASCSLIHFGLNSLRRRLPVVSFFLVVHLLFFSSTAVARLKGEAEIGYSTYEGSAADPALAGGRTSMSTHSLVQNYSLLYSSEGKIYNYRIGSYKVDLGYNFTALNATVEASEQSTKNFNETRGHLVYSGEVRIDPKEIPFKFHAYSRDMNRNNAIPSLGESQENFGSIIGGREQYTNIDNGLHIESGATMVAGVKNGMTNGYNEILRHLPMLLVDFKDSIHRDYRTLSPYDDRLTRLAFVSLNKKDNWFHYRHLRYNDNIDASNNYEENQIQLGSIDQFMSRRWIDFSNWIKVSTDMAINRRKVIDRMNTSEEMNVNLFVTAERSKWFAQTFSTFNRFVDVDKNISYQTALPLYVSGSVDQDLSWNARVSYRDNHDINVSGVSSELTNLLAGYRLDAFKRASFFLSQGFGVESTAVNSSDAITLSGNLDTGSTKRFSSLVSFGASYRIRSTINSSSDGSTSDFLLQDLDIHGGYVPSKTLRFEISQKNTFTNGKNVLFSNAPRNSQIQLSQYDFQGGLELSEVGSKSYQSSSSLSATWDPKPRLNINFTLTEVINKIDVEPVNSQTSFSSAIMFTNQAWSIKNNSAYTRDNNNNNSFSDSASLNYVFNRALNANASVLYAAGYSGESTEKSVSFQQGLNYSYFKTNGNTRTLFEINEKITRSVGSPKSLYPTSNSFTLGLRYYPISRLTIAGGANYSYSTSMNVYSLVWNASVAANFRMLQASVDYASGIRTSDKLRENKLTGNIRKSF